MLLVVLGDPLCTGHVILRMRSELCSLHNGINVIFFSPITWLNLRLSAQKVTKSIGKLGSEISKNVDHFCPR